jgi:hypothetical protein
MVAATVPSRLNACVPLTTGGPREPLWVAEGPAPHAHHESRAIEGSVTLLTFDKRRSPPFPSPAKP